MNHIEAVPLHFFFFFCASVVLYVAFDLSFFDPRLSFLLVLRGVVFCDCGIFVVFSLIYLHIHIQIHMEFHYLSNAD